MSIRADWKELDSAIRRGQTAANRPQHLRERARLRNARTLRESYEAFEGAKRERKEANHTCARCGLPLLCYSSECDACAELARRCEVEGTR